jgi:hypothetical protein
LFVSWCVGGRCGMTYSDEDHGKSRRPDADDQGRSHMLGTRWRFGLKTCYDGFSLVWASKPMVKVCEWFDLKTIRTVFIGFASNSVTMVSGGLASKPDATVFSSLASKLVATVSPSLASKPAADFLVEPQNQGGGGFPGLDLKTGSFGLVIWSSKSPRRFLGLGVKTKRASVYRLCQKTDGERSARDTP